MFAKGSLLAFVIVLAVAAAGCGGDAGGGGGERLSKQEFLSQADGICKEYDAKGEQIKPDLPSDLDPTSDVATDEQLDKYGDYLDEVGDVFGDEIEELRDLNPPEDAEADFDRALDLLDGTLSDIRAAADASRDGDKPKLKELIQASQKRSTETDGIAKRLGLKVCGAS